MSTARVVRVATTSAHKLIEFRQILEPRGYTVLGLEGVGDFNVEEDGETFEANAIKKATALAQRTREAAMADDSGLAVDALGGAPGVCSARYAGAFGEERDAANRHKLLRELTNVEDAARTARFVCALAYVAPGATPLLVRGVCEGMIARAERGLGGFGYDSLFLVPKLGRTMAELLPHEKHAVSHRGRALLAMLRALAGG